MSQTFAAVARHRRSRPSAESRRTEKPGSADLETAAPRRCRRDRRARQPPRAGTQPTPEPRPRSVGLPTSRPPAGTANAPRAAGQDSRPWRLPSIGSSERTCLDDGVALVWAHCRGQPSRAAPASLSPPLLALPSPTPSFRAFPVWRGSSLLVAVAAGLPPAARGQQVDRTCGRDAGGLRTVGIGSRPREAPRSGWEGSGDNGLERYRAASREGFSVARRG
jgi:hypothetical protein